MLLTISVLFNVLLIGILLLRRSSKQETVGTLRVDSSDPDDGPYMFLELKTDPGYVMKQKQVVLDVNTESYLTQK